MKEDFIFSINATMPVFLVMVIGQLLYRGKMISHQFVEECNSFVFKVTLPVMLFLDMATMDFKHDFSGKYVLLGMACTVCGVSLAWMVGRAALRKRPELLGEFIQGCYRGSVAVLGGAFLMNIYPGGEGSAVIGQVLMGCVPLYNAFAVTILVLYAPKKPGEEKADLAVQMKKAVGQIVRNPLILAIVFGGLYAFLRLPMPNIARKTMSSLGSLASPLALLAIGAEFDVKKLKGCLGPTVGVCLYKLLIQPAIFLPIAVMMGWRNQWLIGLMIMFGAPITPSSYIMARNMGHDGVLTASSIAATTLCSAVSVTFWIFLGRTLGLVG